MLWSEGLLQTQLERRQGRTKYFPCTGRGCAAGHMFKGSRMCFFMF